MSELAIHTTGLTRHFGSLTAVDNLSLEVKSGAVYGFLGPNGAGKTTTIRMLLGLIRPDAGAIQVLGESLKERRTHILRRVGSLVESPSLYPHLTGRENLEVLRRLRGFPRAQIDRALHLVRLEDVANRRAGNYSTGMKQRLGIAMALLDDPSLLILDEPTNGLDPAGIIEMRELIRRMPADFGVTVFLSSHLLSEVEHVATHIGIINQGKLLFQGAQEDLRAEMQLQVKIGVDQPDLARQTLAQNGWSVTSNGSDKLAVQANTRSDAAMITAQLREAGINVYHVSLEQPSLEDMFLDLTKSAGTSRSERQIA